MADKKSVKTAEKSVKKIETAEETKPAKKDKADTAKASKKDKAAKTENKPNKVTKYFKDRRSEFKKVVWPSRKTVITNTSVVLITMIVTGIGVFCVDSVFAFLFKQLLEMGG